MTTVFEASTHRDMQNIIIKTNDGIAFVADIIQQDSQFEATVAVLDKASSNRGSRLYQIEGKGVSALEKFTEVVQFIFYYLNEYNQTDSIADVFNPCDCPFISKDEQNGVFAKIGVKLSVRAK